RNKGQFPTHPVKARPPPGPPAASPGRLWPPDQQLALHFLRNFSSSVPLHFLPSRHAMHLTHSLSPLALALSLATLCAGVQVARASAAPIVGEATLVIGSARLRSEDGAVQAV